MVAQIDDPLMRVAAQVADSLSTAGYAFVEDDRIEALAAFLQTFLTVAGIPVNNPADSADVP